MNRFPGYLVAIISFFGLLCLFSKNKKSLIKEEDYYYGDSQYNAPEEIFSNKQAPRAKEAN